MVQVKEVRRVQPTSEGTEEQALLRDRAIKFTREIVKFADVDLKASAQNQARFQALHPETVELYTAAMKDGAVFPPIVVGGAKSHARVVFDGNHRINAAIAAGFEEAEMLVAADTTSNAQRELFTYEANAKHGLPSSMNERVAQGVYLVGLGNSAVDVARALGIPERKLWAAAAERRARVRMERLHAPIGKNWSGSLIQRFGSIRSDTVIVPAAKLAVDARMGATDSEHFIAAINKYGTEGTALAFIEQERERLNPVISSTAGGAMGLPREINALVLGLRMIRNMQPDNLSAALDRVNPEFRDSLGRETVEGVTKLISLASTFRRE